MLLVQWNRCPIGGSQCLSSWVRSCYNWYMPWGWVRRGWGPGWRRSRRRYTCCRFYNLNWCRSVVVTEALFFGISGPFVAALGCHCSWWLLLAWPVRKREMKSINTIPSIHPSGRKYINTWPMIVRLAVELTH